MEKRQSAEINLKRTIITAILGYVCLVVLFYVLAGHQLHFRASRGNLAMPPAEAGTVELAQGAVVEQSFSVKIQRLQSVSVQWGTYYRPNSGTVTMELINQADGSVVLSETFDASAITEGEVTTMTAAEPIETVYGAPLLLRLYADSQPGQAVSPMMSTSTTQDDFSLTLNGEPADGVLCFSATGEDYIWTGLHYWEFAAAFGAVLALAAA